MCDSPCWRSRSNSRISSTPSDSIWTLRHYSQHRRRSALRFATANGSLLTVRSRDARAEGDSSDRAEILTGIDIPVGFLEQDAMLKSEGERSRGVPKVTAYEGLMSRSTRHKLIPQYIGKICRNNYGIARAIDIQPRGLPLAHRSNYLKPLSNGMKFSLRISKFPMGSESWLGRV